MSFASPLKYTLDEALNIIQHATMAHAVYKEFNDNGCYLIVLSTWIQQVLTLKMWHGHKKQTSMFKFSIPYY